MNQKPNEAGWFYHAPVRTVHREQVGAPPPSQIPGLGQIEVLEREVPKEMVFKDTDTKYIRMAKMGGRKDLLTIQPNTEKMAPVGYHRNEWFYLEDNALADKEEKEKEQQEWQFLLPEYMVHQGYQADQPELGPSEADGKPMRRAPYATDNKSSFYEDGTSLTDKTVRIPETMRPGYGVRSAKAPASVKGPAGASRRQPAADRSKPLGSQVQGDKSRLRYQPLPAEKEEPVSMSKLLSNAYDKEWHDKKDTWQQKQKETLDRSKGASKAEGPARTEYNNNYSKPASFGSHKPEYHRKNSSSSNKEPAARREEEKPKEPFKLSKFKNVPSRINTHQSPEVLAAVGN